MKPAPTPATPTWLKTALVANWVAAAYASQPAFWSCIAIKTAGTRFPASLGSAPTLDAAVSRIESSARLTVTTTSSNISALDVKTGQYSAASLDQTTAAPVPRTASVSEAPKPLEQADCDPVQIERNDLQNRANAPTARKAAEPLTAGPASAAKAHRRWRADQAAAHRQARRVHPRAQ